MIRVHVRTGLLGQTVDHVDLPADTMVTPRQLLERFSERMPSSLPVQIAVDGKLLERHGLDEQLQDGQEVVLLPQTGEITIGAILLAVLQYVIIPAALAYAAYLLAPRPRPPGLPQDRGDDASATYSWDGIKTSYGPGLPIAWGYGRHAIGGQVIWMDGEASRSSASSAVDDRLRVILSLMGGRIYRFGNLPAVTTDDLGGIAGPGAISRPSIPQGLRINGNLIPDSDAFPGVRVWMRPGTQDQPALPAPFDGVRQTFSPNLTLDDAGDQATYTWSGTDKVVALAVTLTAPGGVYRQDPTGALVGFLVYLTISVRRPGGAPFQAQSFYAGHLTTAYIGYWAKTYFVNLQIPSILAGQYDGSGPLEITISRATSTLGGSAVSQIVWRDLTIVSPHTLRYPGEALLALEIAAGARFAGGQPQIQLQCDLELVRVWDEDAGWSPRCWDVPAAPFNFNTHPPGRNPAWCLLDYLLSKRHGLGRWITEDKIDLPAFRKWAAFCDQDPNPADPWGEPAFCVDVVGDQPKAHWDWVLTICAAGRAVPVMRSGKISVVYQYRDEHWDLGGGGAPAKTPLQLITAGNCEAVSVSWSSKAERATVINFQFLNEGKSYAQDSLPVEDTDGTMNDPSALFRDQYRSEDVQAYGVTRASQLYREGRWRHRISRLVTREISFTTGPWALAAEVGDLIDFQHEALRPFDDAVSVAMQLIEVDVGASTVNVDHHLTGTGLQIVVRGDDGAPLRRNIASYVNYTEDGRNVSKCTLASPLDVAIGSPCVVGLIDKLVETYQIVSITLQKDLKRQVRAIQWTPEAYDPIPRSDFLGDEPLSLLPSVVTRDDGETLPPSVMGMNVAATEGGHLLRWGRPANKVGTPARVYLRDQADSVWDLVGGTDDSKLLLPGLQVGVTYTASVCLQNRSGEPVPPELGDQLEFVPEEFPAMAPPAVTGARANIVEDDLLVQWDEMQQRSIDYVEVRAGSNWTAARVLARERSPRATIPDPPAGVPLLLAARAPSGLYGPIVQIAAPGWTPPNVVQRLLEDDLAPSPAGAHSGTQWNATDLVLELQDGVLSGTYTSAEQDMSFQAPWFWQVRCDSEEIEDGLVSELDDEPGIGEGLWALVSGRPASPASPGLDWRERVQDDDMPVGDDPATNLVRGPVGVVGSHTQAQVESRFYVDGSWTDYRPHVDGIVLARRMQVRVTLGRRTLGYRARVRLLTYAAYL